jgi:hypothetical protein
MVHIVKNETYSICTKVKQAGLFSMKKKIEKSAYTQKSGWKAVLSRFILDGCLRGEGRRF